MEGISSKVLSRFVQEIQGKCIVLQDFERFSQEPCNERIFAQPRRVLMLLMSKINTRLG